MRRQVAGRWLAGAAAVLLLCVLGPAAVLMMRDAPPGGPPRAVFGGVPRQDLRAAAEAYARAMTASDAASLGAMGDPTLTTAEVPALLRRYGGHTVRPTRYEEDAYGWPTVQYTVRCSGSRQATFYQAFFWTGRNWAPGLGEPRQPPTEALPPESKPAYPLPPPQSCA